MRLLSRTLALIFLVALLALGSPTIAHAAGPEEIFRGGPTVTIAADETVTHDLFLTGQTIRIDGIVQGDVAAAGQRVVVNGTIEGDLWAAAQSVEVNGRVKGDVRVLSGSLSVTGDVGRNVLAAAGDVEVAAQASVGGDLVAFTDRTVINGVVQGDVSGTADEYQRTGTIGGRELIEIRRPGEEEEETNVDWVLGRVRHWLSLMVVGSLFALLWRRGLLTLSTNMTGRPLASLGSGLLVIGGGIVYAVVLLVLLVIISFILGFIGLGGLVAIAWIGSLLSVGVVALGIVFGATLIAGALASLVLGRLAMEGRIQLPRFELWAWLALGAVAYTIAAGLGWVGILIQIAAALFGLGALGLGAWDVRRRRSASVEG